MQAQSRTTQQEQAARIGQPGLDTQYRTVGTGQQGQGSGQDSQDRTARTEQPE
jgi:hypothetical protein